MEPKEDYHREKGEMLPRGVDTEGRRRSGRERHPRPSGHSIHSHFGKHTSRETSVDDKLLVPTFMSQEAEIQEGEEKEWQDADLREWEGLIAMGTFEPVKDNVVRASEEVFKTRFVRTVKDKYALGHAKRYKSRLVVQQMKKLYGAEAFDIYSPTPSMEADRLLVWFAATTGQEIHGLDVVQAYLNAQAPRLEGQRIFVHYPKERKRPGYVLLLHKCLYGLRISARMWNQRLSAALKTMNFRQLRTERCIFTRSDKKGRETIIIVHVDDMKIIGDHEAVRRGLEHQGIKVTDEGRLTTHLGIEYEFTRKGITIHQTKTTLSC